MFHISRLGSFSGSLQRFADLDGYVPEDGDDHDSMNWDSKTEWDDDSWGDFVDQAVKATDAANKAVAEWRDGTDGDAGETLADLDLYDGKVTLHGKPVDFQAAVALMDDDLREQAHRIVINNDQAFLDCYCALHAEKFGEAFQVG